MTTRLILAIIVLVSITAGWLLFAIGAPIGMVGEYKGDVLAAVLGAGTLAIVLGGVALVLVKGWAMVASWLAKRKPPGPGFPPESKRPLR
jgi:hypothetical protein